MINVVLYVCVCVLSCRLFATPWIVAHQAPLSMGFSRQGYQSELPLPSPGDLPDAGIPHAPPALAGGLFTTEPPGKLFYHNLRKNKLEGFSLGFPVAQTVKCLPAVWETWVQSLGWAVESSLVLLEKSICYDQCILLTKLC